MISDELATLRTAAREDDRIDVMESIERLDETFERDRLSSRRFDAIAAMFDQRIDEPDGDGATKGYRETIAALEQSQVELNRATLAYVYNDAPAEAVVEAVDEVEEAYSERNQAGEELERVAADVSLPPLLVVSGPDAIEIRSGTTPSIELLLSNVGGSHVGTIAIDSESDLPASVTPSTVENMNESDTITLDVELSPYTTGEFDAVVVATGQSSEDRFRFTVDVLTKRDYVDRAHRLATTLEPMVGSTEEGRGRRNGLENRVRTLRRRLESISSDLEKRSQPTHSIDNRLNATHNKATAIEHRIESFDPSVERQESIYIINNIIEEIKNAIGTP